jgi:quercetin 2,3-dioxygenase
MNTILSTAPLGMHWPTLDPFLFCAHHDDAYPAGDALMGIEPTALRGRQLGSDFSGKDGWSMYHGQSVPGFPAHPHRGFETVTIVRKGRIDHSDSLGATARFGGGDVQWLTAGAGIVHCEMFPLLKSDAPNPLELFQIWLNLPAKNKMVAPHFTMLWHEEIPRWSELDAQGRATEIVCIAGELAGYCAGQPSASKALPPPPNSWASQRASSVGIFTLKLSPGVVWTLPAASTDVARVLYFFKGESINVAGQSVKARHAIQLRSDLACELTNGDAESELLLLQGRPIGEPVAQHGPFVMNTQAEIQQAFADYQRTQFGGWPWGQSDPVHPRETGRFAKHADGRLEERA